jgi:hypothetical protein
MAMKKIVFSLFVLFLASELEAQQIPDKAAQIKAAVLAAPQDFRKGAKVYGYDANGDWTVLREGNNEMICIADNPQTEGFSVSCYHKDLEPFMERGRALKKEGKNFKQIFDTREKEAKSGSLKMPGEPASLYVLTADKADFDPIKGKVDNTYLRYVIYIPWATKESTGLSTKPDFPGMPWIMDPGTHRAHIMISPPKD